MSLYLVYEGLYYHLRLFCLLCVLFKNYSDNQNKKICEKQKRFRFLDSTRWVAQIKINWNINNVAACCLLFWVEGYLELNKISNFILVCPNFVTFNYNNFELNSILSLSCRLRKKIIRKIWRFFITVLSSISCQTLHNYCHKSANFHVYFLFALWLFFFFWRRRGFYDVYCGT